MGDCADIPPLPGILAEIADLTGRNVALELALTFGGRILYIPKPDHLKPGHVLVDAIGIRAAALIAGQFAGNQFDVPKARKALVRHLAEAGDDNPVIAHRLGLTLSSVRRYRRS